MLSSFVSKKKRLFFYGFNLFNHHFNYGGHLFNVYLGIIEGQFSEIFDAFYQLLNQMSWGIGMGILMIGMNLYKKGASLGQVMAFLIASPWNSLSLTFILFTLIGFKWTLIFILLSAIIGIFSGFFFQILEKKNVLPKNPNEISLPKDFDFWKQVKKNFKKNPLVLINLKSILKNGFKESKVIIKWVLFGALLSSLVKVLIDESFFYHYFGPSLLGLGITLGVTTIIEICSEGAAPLGSDLFQKGKAPGNNFVFLMGGVSTDYTEIMVLKEATKSWKIALFLPLMTIPQILIIGFILNQLS